MKVPSPSVLFWVQMNAVVKRQLNASVPLENIWYLQVCSIIHLGEKKPRWIDKVLLLKLLLNPVPGDDLETGKNAWHKPIQSPPQTQALLSVELSQLKLSLCFCLAPPVLAPGTDQWPC